MRTRKMARWTDDELIAMSEKFRREYDPKATYSPGDTLSSELPELSIIFYEAAKELETKIDPPPKITGDKEADRKAYQEYFPKLYNKLSHSVGGDFYTFNRLQVAFLFKDGKFPTEWRK